MFAKEEATDVSCPWRLALRNLWALSEEDGAPSRLLARTAGCEVLAELCRMSRTSFAPAKGGLASWSKRRGRELLQARLSEDIHPCRRFRVTADGAPMKKTGHGGRSR